MSSLASFLFSRAFWKNIFFAIILGFLIVWGGLWLTGIYTHHGERIAVPDLKGKTLDEVAKTIAENNLNYEVQDSVFNRGAKPGSVIEQFPRGGQEVKRKRLIKLTIAAIAPQKTTISQVNDISLRQAIGQLSKNGIYVKKLEYVPSSYTNLVLGVSLNGKPLKAGDQIYKGEEVILRVGKNEGASFIVPNLIGLSANYAKRKAFESGLNIGKLTFKNNSEEAKKNARVLQQSLAAGVTVVPGERINLILKVPEETTDSK